MNKLQYNAFEFDILLRKVIVLIELLGLISLFIV